MRAEELRKIAEQQEIEFVNKFWEEFKDRMFEYLKKQALARSFCITIGYSDDIAKIKNGGNWIDYTPMRNKVKTELEKLGYNFSYNDARQGEYVTINWQ